MPDLPEAPLPKWLTEQINPIERMNNTDVRESLGGVPYCGNLTHQPLPMVRDEGYGLAGMKAKAFRCPLCQLIVFLEVEHA